MPQVQPHIDQFRTAVHGTVFADRTRVVHRLKAGDQLILVPDPPCAGIPAVWVHAAGGDVVGHVPLQIAAWLAPWMFDGGRCQARVERVGSDDVESWRRLVIRCVCRTTGDSGFEGD
jgi:HIRAN domain-containing protein